MTRRIGALFSLLMSSILLISMAAQQRAVQAQANERCFPETGYCVSGRLLEFWNTNGGLPVFGYPTSPQQQEVIEGQTLQVQWFERNRLELHPENQRPYDVLLGRLGADRLEQMGRNWHNNQRSPAQAGCRYFDETGFNVCGEILAAWRANGLELDGRPGKTEAENLALFGLPLGDAAVETIEGQPFLVQWFERARFELHPENAPPHNVLLGLLANEVQSNTDGTPPGDPPPGNQPGTVGQIVFESTRDGHKEIYLMNEDGSNQRRMTFAQQGDPNAANEKPAWSPDGTQIVFDSYRNQGWEIYVMNADGSGGPRQLTSNAQQVTDSSSSWAPDPRIIFQSNRSGNMDIYAMNADGSGTVNLTNHSADDAYPTWSPDRRIAFQSDRLGIWDIWLMNDNGSGLINWSNSPTTSDGRPIWSPDGTRMAFQSDREGTMDIYVANADGSALRNLTGRYGGSPNDVNPSWSPDGSKIVFQSNRSGNWDIWMVNADDGSGLVPLTDHAEDDRNPEWWPIDTGLPTRLPDREVPQVRWSPDGRVVYTADAGGNMDIFVMNANGTGKTNLTNSPEDDYSPRWSPDGSRVVFTAQRGGNTDIYVMNADGSGQTRLTSDPAPDTNPDWSPDGSRIVFNSERISGDSLFGNADIYVMNADGSNQTNLTNSGSYEWRPAWSPDGSRIAFEAAREGDHDIYVMNADGSGQTRLTSTPGFDEYPRWSPDGSRLLFQTDRHGAYEVYVMNADGGGQTSLSRDPDQDIHPDWSPDGSSIIFVSDREGNEEVYVMNADGSGQTNITNHPAGDRFPDWTP
jgi:Tol biopolymer transport system component